MTSSLVGSEMCIRDRQPGDRCTQRPRDSSRCRLGGYLGWTSHRSVSVSYTHLTLPTICSV
eukprot:8060990-Prorocentrum_lima.AAC.1